MTEKKRQSFLSRASAFFREKAEKARRRGLINEAFREVRRLTKGPIPLADEYFFKGACAGLLDTPGFIPSSYIMEVARMSNERGRGEAAEWIDDLPAKKEVH